MSQLSEKDYRVAWICALPIEVAAAMAMLDEQHQMMFASAPNDDNSYTLGRIHRHNVVIACLPVGLTGSNAAAVVASNLSHTFRSIRFTLLVGLGGGIPNISKGIDIRLGDVAVACPDSTSGGLIQYDKGKVHDDGEADRLERRGAIDRPPTVLLSALSILQSKHIFEGSKISQYLKEMFENLPRLKQQGFLPPAQGFDILKCDHDAHKGTSCENCEHGRVKRPPRESAEPSIHYGVIATGNLVIGSARYRNKLRDDGAICVEMEASGVREKLPCLVIRGISDYCDSTKKDDWQGYASATASSFAKELLAYVSLEQTNQAPSIEESFTNQTISRIASDTQSLLDEQNQRKLRKLFDWLLPFTPSTQHQKCQDIRLENSGRWLLEDPTFLRWVSGTLMVSTLCCYGDMGVGKTIMVSVLIDHIRQLLSPTSRAGLGYFYCNYRDQKAQTLETILSTMSQQLLEFGAEVPSKVWQMYHRHRGKTLSSAERSEIAKILFCEICAQLNRVYIYIDALDELSYPHDMLAFFRDRPANVQLFVSGRPHIQKLVRQELGETQEIHIRADEDDLQRYIRREIGGPNDVKPVEMDEALRTNIINTIMKSAQGNFLLLTLQLRHVLGEASIRDREEALMNLAPNLRAAFSKTFRRIASLPNSVRAHAKHLIAWVHLADRLLTMNELRCSLAIRRSDEQFHPRGIPQEDHLLDCCYGLLITDQDTSTVRLVHHSLEEILRRSSHIFERSRQDWHGDIAAVCLQFLGFAAPTNDSHAVQHSFLRYAAANWGHHVRESQNARSDIVQMAKDYLRKGFQKNTESLVILYNAMRWDTYSMMDHSDLQGRKLTPAHVGAFFGIIAVISDRTLTGVDLDIPDDTSRTPLLWAVCGGHKQVVRLLVEYGARLDITDEDSMSALDTAVWYDDDAMVCLLLQLGANINAVDHCGWTPLSIAVRNGCTSAVRQLLKHDALVNLPDKDGWTPLHFAAHHGGHEVTLLLIQCKAAVDAQGKLGESPLSVAAECGHIEVAQSLVEVGAKIDLADTEKRTPLSYAAEFGHKAVVQLLAEADASTDTSDIHGNTPFSYATQNGHEAIAQLLRSYDAKDGTPV